VRAQPRFFREIVHPARGQVTLGAVDHHAVSVRVVRGLNPVVGSVRVRMASLIAERVRRGVFHGLVSCEGDQESEEQAASQQPNDGSSGHGFLSPQNIAEL
jgi:hypothetical protein